MANRLMRLVATLAVILSIVPALAQTVLPDPTRPPVAVAAGTPEVGEAGGPVLQSVVIPRKGMPVAVISGQQVRLGGRYGESRLVKLNEKEAVLEGSAGLERLMLTPGVEKKNVATKIATKNINKAPAGKRGQGGSKP